MIACFPWARRRSRRSCARACASATSSLDTGFADLDRDIAGSAVTTLDGPDEQRLSIWQDERFDYLQVFTTDAYPGQDYAVAIEPMSIPTDAFNSGRALTWLEPGKSCELSWGVAYSA